MGSHSRLGAARARLVADSVRHLDRHLRLGLATSSSTSCARPTRRSRSTRPASGGCGASSTSTARREINELHVPVGRAVKVVFTSEDVLHDLFIPAFRMKADAIPGRYSAIWFSRRKSANTTCSAPSTAGRRHSGMIGTVFVMEQAEYQAWLTRRRRSAASLAAARRAAVQQLACITCHLPDGTAADRRSWTVRPAGEARRRRDRSRWTKATSANRFSRRR